MHAIVLRQCMQLYLGNLLLHELATLWVEPFFTPSLCELFVQKIPNEVSFSQWEAGIHLPDWITPSEMRVIEAESTETFLASSGFQPESSSLSGISSDQP